MLRSPAIHLLGLPLGALSVGCSLTAAPLLPDRGSDVAIEEAVAALAAGPEAAAALLNPMPDPIAQEVLLWVMVAHDVGRTWQVCPHLTATSLQGQCRHLTNRPHLLRDTHHTGHGTGAASPGEGGPGPAASTFPLPTEPWAAHPVADVSDDCGEQLGTSLCRLEEAEAHSARGQVAVAGGWCHTISRSLWREECHFRVAENMMMHPHPSGDYAVAVAFCLDAGALAGRCLDRLQESIGLQAPPADAPPEAWAPLQAQLGAVRDTWRPAWPAGEPRAVQSILAVATATSVGQSDTPGGAGILRALGAEAEAAPQVRAALAARWIRTHHDTTESLADLVARVQAMMTAEATAAAPAAPDEPTRTPAMEVRDLWMVDAAASRDLPVISYLGSSRRLLSSDPDADAAIAVLEAAVRWAARPTPLLEAGAQHADPGVRWTAARLQQRQGLLRRAATVASGTPQ